MKQSELYGDKDEDDETSSTPPFHYGTHYSCAGYVINYLIRLQPYTNMAIALQVV
jgi:hypothetical protein